MRKRVVILGTTMFSAELSYILKSEDYEVIAFCVDSAFKTSDCYDGLPVYSSERVENEIDTQSVSFALAIGYSRMNEVRKSKYEQCKIKGYKLLTFISKHSQIYTEKVGEGSIIMPGTYIGPLSEIGLCTVIRPGTVLAHHDIIGNYNWIADGCTFGGGVAVGDNCFIGLGTTVRNEISIANRTLIGAQSYIGMNTEEGKAYYGVPGKVADKESFEIINRV